MTELRAAYKRWGDTIHQILQPLSDAAVAGLMPAFHPLPLDKMTVGDWLDYRANLQKGVQVRNIIALLMEER